MKRKAIATWATGLTALWAGSYVLFAVVPPGHWSGFPLSASILVIVTWCTVHGTSLWIGE